MKEFIALLPTSIKEKLSKEEELLKKKDLVKDNFNIIANNLIAILYKLFKEKYEEIKKSNDILYFTDNSAETMETMEEKKEEKRKAYFQLDKKDFINLKNESIIQDTENENKTEGYNTSTKIPPISGVDLVDTQIC